MGISLKVNIIAQLEFELAYFKATVQHFSYYATETFPIIFFIILLELKNP